jgi:hypothetical protein
LGYNLNSLRIKDGGEELQVPIVGVRKPEIRDHTRERCVGDRQKKVVVNRIPYLTPRRGPNRDVAIMNLIDDILDKVLFNLENGRPKDGARAIRFGRPEGGRVKIFGLNNASQERIFCDGDIPGSMSDKTFVDSVKVSDAKTPILFGLADILLGTEGNRIGRVVFLNTCPPKFTIIALIFSTKILEKRTVDM